MINQLDDQLNNGNGGQYSGDIQSPQPLPSPLDQARNGYGYGNGQGQPGQPGQQYTGQTFRSLAAAPPSRLETDYSHRAGTTLQQYGYDAFRNFRPSSGTVQAGAVPDTYVLGIGDQVVITLRGQTSRSISTRVDRDGRIVVPNLPPIPAAGLTFAEMRASLENSVAQTFTNAQVFVSLGAVRQISVAVLGEVQNPGLFQLGGFATALDALAYAGGVKKTGTLRHILLVHADGTTVLDLYSLFNGGQAQKIGLQDGDRIIVRPVGPTVAVAGEVDRPGIYELSSDDAIGGGGLLALAGEPLRPIGNRYIRLRLDRQGADEATELAAGGGVAFRDGDILLVLHKRDLAIGTVQIAGHVRVPGIQSLLVSPDLRSLIGSYDTFADDPYLLFAALETTDPQTLARHFVPVNLRQVLDGEQDIQLKSDDTLIVFGEDDIRYLSSADVQAVLTGQTPPILNIHQPPRRRGTANQYTANGDQYTADGDQYTADDASGYDNSQNSNLEGSAATAAATGFAPGTDNGRATANDNTQPSPTTYLSSLANTDQDTKSSDTVLPYTDRQSIAPSPFQNAPAAQQHKKPPICRGLQSLAALNGTGQLGRFANAIQSVPSKFDHSPSAVPNILPCPKIFDQYPELLPFVIEYSAALHGQVRSPGIYPITIGTDLQSLVATAGGLTRNVDLNAVEITHYDTGNPDASVIGRREILQLATADMSRVLLAPGDAVRFNQVYDDRDSGPVILSGEFLHPGVYDIRRGEHLSEVIARAGGLTPEAFPYGAVFTRESVKSSEQVASEREVRELQSGILASLSHSGTQATSAQSEAPILQNFIAEIRNSTPIGRVVVETDPAILAAKPQEDTLLEPGDTLTMPKRPSYVTVSGQVLNPTSIAFQPGATVKDYIHQAGDYAQSAYKKGIFVVLPNGIAEPVRISFWHSNDVNIPPGSTIVVPRDVSGYDFLSAATDLTAITSQIAITAASLAVLSKQ